MTFAQDLGALREGRLTFARFAARHGDRFRRWAAYFYERWPQRTLDVEDLVQEALLEAWRAVDTWDPDGAAIDRYVEYQVGRKLRVELERVLGWPKKAGARRPGSPEQKPVRPLSMALPGVERAVEALGEEATSGPFERLVVREAAESAPDDLTRDVIAGIGSGLSARALAAYLWEDAGRRIRYRLDSREHAVRVVRRAVRQATAQAG